MVSPPWPSDSISRHTRTSSRVHEYAAHPARVCRMPDLYCTCCCSRCDTRCCFLPDVHCTCLLSVCRQTCTVRSLVRHDAGLFLISTCPVLSCAYVRTLQGSERYQYLDTPRKSAVGTCTFDCFVPCPRTAVTVLPCPRDEYVVVVARAVVASPWHALAVSKLPLWSTTTSIACLPHSECF